MIDTVRFKLSVTNPTTRLDLLQIHSSGGLTFQKHLGRISVGSYSYAINILIVEGQCFLEYSVPKHLNGFNVGDDAIDRPDLYRSALKLYDDLNGVFFDCTHPDSWVIQRIDFCRNFLVKDSCSTMEKLQQLIVPRKKRSVFQTSVMFVGSAYSLKFYEKQPEYEKHDMQKLMKKDSRIATELFNKSKNIVRFEITLRKKAITAFFGVKELTLFNFVKTDMLLDKVLEKLEWAQKAIGQSALGEDLVKVALVSKWGEKKGGKLYLFWKKYITATGRKEYERILSRKTIYNYLDDIDQAMISMEDLPEIMQKILERKRSSKKVLKMQ